MTSSQRAGASVEGLNQRRLHYFREAMKAGSMRAAAEQLGIEPSVISRQIQILEKELNVTLVERRGRGVSPNEAGRLVLEACEERRLADENLRSRLDELNGMDRGEISIVTGEGYIKALMTRVVRVYSFRYPRIHVHVETTDADDAVARVVNDRAHVGLTLCPPAHPAVRTVSKQLLPLCAISSCDHPFALRSEPTSLREIGAYPIGIARPGSGLGTLIQQAEVAEGVQLSPVFTTNSVEALRQFVMAGLGVTIMSRQAVAAELTTGTFVARRTTNPVLESANVQAFVRAGRRFSAATQAWLDVLDQANLFGANPTS